MKNQRKALAWAVGVAFVVGVTAPRRAEAGNVLSKVTEAVTAPVRAAVQQVRKVAERARKTFRRHMTNVFNKAKDVAKKAASVGQKIANKVRSEVEKGVNKFKKGVGDIINKGGLQLVKAALSTLLSAVEKGGKNALAAARGPLEAVSKLLPGPLGKAFDVGAITKAIADGGANFGKDARKCLGAFKKLEPGQVVTLVKCMVASVVSNLPGLGQFVKFLKEIGFPGKINGAQALLKAFTKLGDAGYKGIEAVYKLGLGKIPGVPKLETIKGLWAGAQKMAGQLAGGKSLGDGLQKLIEKVLGEIAEVVPKIIEKFTGFRDGVRKLLTLELKTPFEKNAAVQGEIERVARNVLDPLLIVIAGLVKKVVPAKIVDDTITLVKKPLMTMWSALMRSLIFGRSVLKQAARLILPRIIEGGAAMAKWFDKLKIPPVVKNVLLAVFDQMHGFFGGIGSFLLTLVPELKATVERVLDSLVGAGEDVKSVLATLSGASKAKSPLDMLNVMAGATGGGGEGGGRGTRAAPAKRLDKAAIAKARQAYASAQKKEQKAMRAAEDADNAHLEAKLKSESAAAAAKAKSQAARDAAEKANEAARAAHAALLRVDPDAATERVISIVWEKLSEGFLKVVWDGGTAVADLFVTSLTRLYLFGMQVVIAAAGGIGGVFVVTIDWVPLLAELYGTVSVTLSQIMAEAGRTIFNSVVLPEIRMLVKDQLVDYGTLFVELWKDPKKRKEIQVIGKVVTKLFESMGPFAERLAKVRDTVKAGAAALYTGPLAGFFKMLPPQLFAAISKAVTKGAELLQQLAIQLAKKVAAAVASKGKGGKGERTITPQEIAKLIIAEVREPVIEYLTSLLPDEDEFAGLKKALAAGLNTAADRLERDPSPAKLLNPAAMIKLIGDGLVNAREGLGQFLAGTWKLQALEGVISAAIGRVGKLLQSGQIKKEVLGVLAGGPLGLIREIFALKEPGKKSLQEFIIDDILLKNAPADLKDELRASLQGAFQLVLKPGALAGVLRGGIRGVVAKVVELSHAPLTKLLLRDFPEGPVTQALRETLHALGKEASHAKSPLFDKLAKGGLAGIAGMILAKEKVAGALALVLTADLGDAGDLRGKLQAAIARTGDKLAQSGLGAQFTKSGIKSLLVDFGRPVAEYLIEQLAKGVQHQGLAKAVRTLLLASVDDLVGAKTMSEALRNVPQRFLQRVGAYAKKLVAQVQTLAKTKVAEARAALERVASSLRSALSTAEMLKEANRALVEASAALAGTTLPAAEEVLR